VGGLLVSRRWVRAMTALARADRFDSGLPLRANIGPAFDPDRFEELDTTHVVVHRWPLSIPGLLPAGARLLERVHDIEVWKTPSLGPVFLGDHSVPAGLSFHLYLE